MMSSFLIIDLYCVIEQDFLYLLFHFGTSGMFPAMIITNKDTMNIVEHGPPWYGMATFGYMPKRGIAGSSGISISDFQRKLQIDFQRVWTSLQPQLRFLS